jgi:hypothetical protein
MSLQPYEAQSLLAQYPEEVCADAGPSFALKLAVAARHTDLATWLLHLPGHSENVSEDVFIYLGNERCTVNVFPGLWELTNDREGFRHCIQYPSPYLLFGDLELCHWLQMHGHVVHGDVLRAFEGGNMDVVQWVWDMWTGDERVVLPKVLQGALRSGSLEVAEWACILPRTQREHRLGPSFSSQAGLNPFAAGLFGR